MSKIYEFVKGKGYVLVGVSAPLITAGLTVTSTGVTIDSADVTTVQDANAGFLTTIFQTLDFIPTIAIMAGGMYVLNKIFSLIPGSGGAK